MTGIFTTGGFTTAQSISIDDLIATADQMRADRKRLDDNLLESLKLCMRQSGDGVLGWSIRLRIPMEYLAGYISGARPVDSLLWEACRRMCGEWQQAQAQAATPASPA